MDPAPSERSPHARPESRGLSLTATGLAALFFAALAGIFCYRWANPPSQRTGAHGNAQTAGATAADAKAAGCHRDYDRRDYAAAARSCREAATLGDAAAQRNLGLLCHLGLGMQRNDADAVNWLGKAAAQGDPDAQIKLAAMYREGNGVKRDYAQALYWYREAAARGIADAQFNLGQMIYNGYGVKRDYGEAMSWFRMAAAQGNAAAQKMFLEAEQRASEPVLSPTPQGQAGYFTVGSSKTQVLALQGTPTSVQAGYPPGSEQWFYDRCSVTFDIFGSVKAYSNSCGMLHVSMKPVQLFTIGSSKAQVLAIQGTPTTVHSGYPRGSEEWSYDGCSVSFDESGRVSGYSNMCGQLHVEMTLPTNGGNGAHVTVDRHSDYPYGDNDDD